MLPSKGNTIPGNDINVDVEVKIFAKTPQNQAQISKFAQILLNDINSNLLVLACIKIAIKFSLKWV